MEIDGWTFERSRPMQPIVTVKDAATGAQVAVAHLRMGGGYDLEMTEVIGDEARTRMVAALDKALTLYTGTDVALSTATVIAATSIV